MFHSSFSLHGAIKPPWVKPKEFTRTPFNYCDRWCERCLYTTKCRVFTKSKKHETEWQKLGRSLDDPEFTFFAMQHSFTETFELLGNMMKERGVTLTREDLEAAERAEADKPDPMQNDLFKLTHSLSQKIRQLMKQMEIIPIDADFALIEEQQTILAWYVHFIAIKTSRAVSSAYEETQDQAGDSDGSRVSAFLDIHGLLNTAQALTTLAKHQPLKHLRPKLTKLAQQCLEIVSILDEKFRVGVVESLSRE